MRFYAVYKFAEIDFEKVQPCTIHIEFFKDIYVKPIGYSSSIDKIYFKLISLGFRVIDAINTSHGKFNCDLNTYINGKGDIIIISPLEMDDSFEFLEPKPEFEIIKVCDQYRITNKSNNTTICISKKEFLALKEQFN